MPALRRVARYGDGWHPVGANPAVPLRPAELRASLDQLFRMTEAQGSEHLAETLDRMERFGGILFEPAAPLSPPVRLDRLRTTHRLRRERWP
jgi:hypothetical protein